MRKRGIEMPKQLMKLLLVALVLSFSVMGYQSTANAQIIGGDFPIGSEVPFPWDMIEGDWVLNDADSTFYRFRVLSISENGTRRVWVQQYDSDENVIAQGSAFVRRNRRVLHARLQAKDGSKFRLRFASYSNMNNYGCDHRAYTIQIKELNTRGEVVSEESSLVRKKRNVR